MSLQTSKLPNSYWKSTENRKKLLDEIAKKLNIKTPSEWGKVTQQQFYKHGGNSLLTHYYNGSIFACVQSVYKDINWKKEWFDNLPQFPRSHWKSIENRKKLLDEIAKKLNIKTPSEWGKVTQQHFNGLKGRSLLNYYNGSLFACLQSVYKDINWKKEWFDKLPNSHWKSMENHKNFLDEIAKKLNIKTPSDWGSVTNRQFFELGGGALLVGYYNGSLFKCLKSVYKDINWQREWFLNLPQVSNSYWKSMENRKKFLDEAAKKLNIKTPSDWGKVTQQQFCDLGGGSFLNYYYNGSIFACLQSVYKDINWKREWFENLPQFPKTHWKSMENRKNFLDEIAKKLNIKTPSDWGNISQRYLYELGGNTLLRNYYKGSLFACLQSVYKETNWKKEWFRIPNRIFPQNHFQNFKNQLKFFDNLTQQYNLQNPSDWKMVSLNLIKKRGGGPLLARYNNSISNALNAIYPSIGVILTQNSSLQQKKAANIIQNLGTKVKENFQ